MENVFERYHRGNQAKQQSAGGTGLGLPIAKTIVTAHQGQIAAESAPGEGTTFCIQMPLITESVEVMEAQ